MVMAVSAHALHSRLTFPLPRVVIATHPATARRSSHVTTTGRPLGDTRLGVEITLGMIDHVREVGFKI